MFLNKAKGGQSSERAGQAKRVLEKRQMTQDFYSASGTKGKCLVHKALQAVTERREDGGKATSHPEASPPFGKLCS